MHGNTICLVFDRLHCGYLGAYGNAWIDTPEFDRFASQGFVFDQMLIDSPKLDSLCRSYWLGRHAGCVIEPGGESLIARLNQRQIETVLVTDDAQVAGHGFARDFRQRIEIDPVAVGGVAETLDDTHLASCFAQIIDRLPQLPQPFFLWCHLAGLGTHWDAPWELRTRYVEEGDPEVEPSARVPCRLLPADAHPDTVVSAYQAYAGQIGVWDACLGALVDFLDDAGLAETFVALTSARGFPLGEHRRIGPIDSALYGPLIHVPLVLRLPGGLGATGRSSALVEPADLWATLVEWTECGGANSPTGKSLFPLIRGESESLRDRLCIHGKGGELGLRTPAWYLRQTEQPELFAKPGDRWEVNNVADRCAAVVELAQSVLATRCKAISCGNLADLLPLDDVLVRGLE
jgi:hypothetical protein